MSKPKPVGGTDTFWKRWHKLLEKDHAQPVTDEEVAEFLAEVHAERWRDEQRLREEEIRGTDNE